MTERATVSAARHLGSVVG